MLDKKLKPLADLINKLYEMKFENYPTNPKFTIWRFMIKIWIKHVYWKNEKWIIKAFIDILCSIR